MAVRPVPLAPGPSGVAPSLIRRIEGGSDSLAVAPALLRQSRVAVAPGAAFGRGGESAVGLCCAADESILEPALERLARFIASGSRG